MNNKEYWEYVRGNKEQYPEIDCYRLITALLGCLLIMVPALVI